MLIYHIAHCAIKSLMVIINFVKGAGTDTYDKACGGEVWNQIS